MSHTRRYTTQAREAQMLLRAAAALGLPDGDLLRAAGLTREQIQDPDARIPYQAAMVLWDEIPRRAGREHFALEAVKQVPIGSHDLLDYVARHSATLGEAFQQVIRFQRIIFDGGSLSFEVDAGAARIRHALRDGAMLPRHLSEFVLATFLLRGRSFVGDALTLRETRFRHAAPADTAPHRELFGPHVRFAQPVTEIVFDPDVMRLPVRGADPSLRTVLERHAAMLLERSADPDDFVARVRADICVHIKAGPTTAREVARRVGTSERTLHRRLADEGIGYQDLVDAVRKELAVAHIRDRDAPLAEVAFLLGFSEASSFHRAFRRWTGTTPASYRRALVA